MKIFLSYAAPDRTQADAVHRALREAGHEVFFDREDLPPGEEFHGRIRQAIERSHVFVILLTPQALDAGSYTLTELAIADRTFARVSGRVLPVLVKSVDYAALPALVKAVTVLEPPGDLASAVVDAVHLLARARRWRLLRNGAGALAASALLAFALWAVQAWRATGGERQGNDGAPLVAIPAGTAILGDDDTVPRREVYLDAYFIDRFEITVARYAEFLAATGRVGAPDGWSAADLEEDAELPVVGVDWRDAEAYCRWAGRRLPTEAEWEKAARGADERRYPWGNETPTLAHANFANAAPEPYDGGLLPVGTHPRGRSPYGVHDLAGNVSEWVADWYSERFRRSDVRNPHGPTAGETRVVRGGDRYAPAAQQRASLRWFGAPDLRTDALGFRCAEDAR